MRLSVVLAAQNEEGNLKRSLEAVKDIANEIIVVDDGSTDKTSDIAHSFGARVYPYKHKNNFHEAKQYGIEKAKGEWILQLDADEVVTRELRREIERVIKDSVIASETKQSQQIRHPEQSERSTHNSQPITYNQKRKLFTRYQQLIKKRDRIQFQTNGTPVAYFIPRVNIFLGRPLIRAGSYPDGVIRLFKNGKAYLPAKSVHELPKVDGPVGWLYGDLLHYDSPTFQRYLERSNRYTDITAKDFAKQKLPVNIFYLFYYSFIHPLYLFLTLYLRHKGILDGFPGFVWCLFSALHPTISYFKYYQSAIKN